MIKKEIDKYKYGDFVFSYYKFLDKFHVEPKTWQELFESSEYTAVSTSIKNLIKDFGSR